MCRSAAQDEFANYVPKTEHDNTPYRFNMDKGKKFTAAEFDAWMKSRGVRVVQARPTGEAAAPAAAEACSGCRRRLGLIGQHPWLLPDGHAVCVAVVVERTLFAAGHRVVVGA